MNICIINRFIIMYKIPGLFYSVSHPKIIQGGNLVRIKKSAIKYRYQNIFTIVSRAVHGKAINHCHRPVKWGQIGLDYLKIELIIITILFPWGFNNFYITYKWQFKKYFYIKSGL